MYPLSSSDSGMILKLGCQVDAIKLQTVSGFLTTGVPHVDLLWPHLLSSVATPTSLHDHAHFPSCPCPHHTSLAPMAGSLFP